MIRKSKNTSIIRSSAAEYLTYVAATGSSDESIELRYEDENIWLTQKMMATLYGVNVRTINDHIKKIYGDSELSQEATIRKYRIVQTEGNRQVSREVIYNRADAEKESIWDSRTGMALPMARFTAMMSS